VEDAIGDPGLDELGQRRVVASRLQPAQPVLGTWGYMFAMSSISLALSSVTITTRLPVAM
jgi:hypothetical protein